MSARSDVTPPGWGERDELAAALRDYGDDPSNAWSYDLADDLLAAGWSRPRWVTDVDQLDDMDLPVIAAGDGWVEIVTDDVGFDLNVLVPPFLVFAIPAWSPPAETDGTERPATTVLGEQ